MFSLWQLASECDSSARVFEAYSLCFFCSTACRVCNTESAWHLNKGGSRQFTQYFIHTHVDSLMVMTYTGLESSVLLSLLLSRKCVKQMHKPAGKQVGYMSCHSVQCLQLPASKYLPPNERPKHGTEEATYSYNSSCVRSPCSEYACSLTTLFV